MKILKLQMKYVRLRMLLRRFNRETVNYIRRRLKRKYGLERRLKMDSSTSNSKEKKLIESFS